MEKKNTPAHHEFAGKLYLKVNIQCCEACPRKAKEKLQKLPGVLAVSVDRERGLVAVSGTVDPPIVIQKFAKLGKKAVLVSPPGNPIQCCFRGNSRGKSTQFNQHNDAKKRYPDFCCHEDDSDNDHICDEINLWQSHHGITMINRGVPRDIVENYKPSAPIVGTKMGENSCCLSGLFGPKKVAAGHNKFPDVGPGFGGATAGAGFGPNNNMYATGHDMPYGGASRPHQCYRPIMAYGNQPAARPPACPHYRQAMYSSAPPLQPSGFTQSMAPPPPPPPTEFCPMIHYNRYEDNYY